MYTVQQYILNFERTCATHNRNLKNLEWKYTKECWAEEILSPLDHNNRAPHMVDAVVAHTAQEHPVERNRFIRLRLRIDTETLYSRRKAVVRHLYDCHKGFSDSGCQTCNETLMKCRTMAALRLQFQLQKKSDRWYSDRYPDWHPSRNLSQCTNQSRTFYVMCNTW